MWVKRGFDQVSWKGRTGLTIGAFDGVHRGHQTLIRAMVTGARAASLDAVVLTFDPLPRQVFGHGKVELLSTLEERLALLEPLGVDGVVVIPFSRDIAATSATDFVAWMVDALALRGLWVGPDFTLGRDQQGDIPFLTATGAQRGFSVHIFNETVRWEGRPVRSSRIRYAVKAGDMRQAAGCLDRPYSLTGIVGHGEARGRTLGFPTANIDVPSERLLPGNGIYVCRAHLPSGSVGAVTNVGTRPTFGERPPNVEAYLLDFDADIYGERLQLDFLHRLRPELRFPSAEALIDQMRLDEANARAYLSENFQHRGTEGTEKN